MIGFIGAGQMARALAKGLVHADLFAAGQVWASDPVAEAREAFAALLPESTTVDDNLELVQQCRTVVLAVKPQQIESVIEAINSHLDDSHLVISIAAGIRLAYLAERLTRGSRLVRVMPNTPCLVGQGASAYALGRGANEADGQFLDRILSSVGMSVCVAEEQLDAVTAVSGSGPAFFCAFLQSLTTAGTECGLPESSAAALALQTMQGTAAYLQETAIAPDELIKRVSSPGGTTVAGLAALEAGNLQDLLRATVTSARDRSIELGDR